MKTIKILVVLSVLMNTTAIQAQFVSTGFGETGSFRNDATKTERKQIELRYSSIEGSPYNTKKFTKSDIYFKDGNVKRGIYVRLNLYENNLEFEHGLEFYILTKLEHVEKIAFSNQEIIYIGKKHKGNLRGFYRLNIGGDNQLLSSLKVEFKEAVSATNSYSEDSQPSFKLEKEKYYLLLKNGNLKTFKNRKNFYSEFSSSNDELVEYVKKNKLNPNKYEGLSQIVKFLNTQEQPALQ